MPMIKLIVLLSILVGSGLLLRSSFGLANDQCKYDPNEARDAVEDAKKFARQGAEPMSAADKNFLHNLNASKKEAYDRELSQFRSARAKAGGNVREMFSKYDETRVFLRADNGNMVTAEGDFWEMDQYGSGFKLRLKKDLPEFNLKQGQMLEVELDRPGQLTIQKFDKGQEMGRVALPPKPKAPEVLTQIPAKYRAPGPNDPISISPNSQLADDVALAEVRTKVLSIPQGRYVNLQIPNGRISPQDLEIIKARPVKIINSYTNAGAWEKSGLFNVGKSKTILDLQTQDGQIIRGIPLDAIDGAFSP